MNTFRRLTALILTLSLALPFFAACRTKDGKLLINEVMPKNTSFLTDASGDTPDWVELYNAGETDVSLKGWFLSDDELNPDRYALPDVTVKAGEYRVVYCDGRGVYDPETDEIHASFSLSGEGETVYLLSRNGRLDKVEIAAALSNVSYGRTDTDEYAWFAVPTPGKANGGATGKTPDEVVNRVEAGIAVTEYSHANADTLLSPSGVYCGFVTVKNITDATHSLAGYTLSDTAGKPEKWHFPSVSLEPNETFTVWCSGADTENEASFKLSASDTALVLSLAGNTVQAIPLTQ